MALNSVARWLGWGVLAILAIGVAIVVLRVVWWLLSLVCTLALYLLPVVIVVALAAWLCRWFGSRF